MIIRTNSENVLLNAKISDRRKGVFIKFDKFCNPVEDSYPSEHEQIAKEYGKRLKDFLTGLNINTETPSSPTPQQLFHPLAIKETTPPIAAKSTTEVVGESPSGESQLSQDVEHFKKRESIKEFCTREGIDLEHHKILYKRPLENTQNIVKKCKEKKIKFTPFRDFLIVSSERFDTNLKALENYPLDPNEHHYLLTYPEENLPQNLQTCKSEGRDPVKESFTSKLSLEPGEFKRFLGTYSKLRTRLSAEEREKEILEIMAEHGVKKEDVTNSVKKLSPVTVEGIIRVCDKYHFDWKKHQYVFSWGVNVLESNLKLCSSEGKDPEKLVIVSKLCLPEKEFEEFLKNYKPLKQFLTPEECEKRFMEIAEREGMKWEEVSKTMKKEGPIHAENIITVCKKHNFDWKNNPNFFLVGPKSLDSKFQLCSCNNVDLSKLTVWQFLLPMDQFRERIKNITTERGAEFRELQS